jgi:hypothetical protein
VRGSFHGRYIKTHQQRHQANAKFPRLLDCLIVVAQSDDDEYFDEPAAGEFAVVDVVTKEKAWFEMPFGANPDILRGLIEGHFAAPAFRVGDKLWFV